jgi:hypothetical protein
MKVIKNKKIEGCLDGTNVRDILLDGIIEKDLIEYLGQLGRLVYKAEMEKPFFRVIVRGKYTIRGSQGNKSMRVILPDDAPESDLNEIADFIAKF